MVIDAAWPGSATATRRAAIANGVGRRMDMPDGSVGEVKVTRSLDPIFGLDQEAIKAAKMWRFRPGMRQGEPVPVIITIELTFTLR